MNSLKSLSVFLLPIIIFIAGTGATTTSTPSSSSFIPISQWRTSFRNLTAACRNGDSYHGLSSVKFYLNRYGYLEDSESKTYDDLYNDGFRSALMAYQKNFHVKPTGQLDKATLKSMMKPRCGVPDVGGISIIHGRNLFTLFPGSPRWPPTHTSLTYGFSSNGVSITTDVLSAVLDRAFQRWASVTSLTFTEVINLPRRSLLHSCMNIKSLIHSWHAGVYFSKSRRDDKFLLRKSQRWLPFRWANGYACACLCSDRRTIAFRRGGVLDRDGGEC